MIFESVFSRAQSKGGEYDPESMLKNAVRSASDGPRKPDTPAAPTSKKTSKKVGAGKDSKKAKPSEQKGDVEDEAEEDGVQIKISPQEKRDLLGPESKQQTKPKKINLREEEDFYPAKKPREKGELEFEIGRRKDDKKKEARGEKKKKAKTRRRSRSYSSSGASRCGPIFYLPPFMHLTCVRYLLINTGRNCSSLNRHQKVQDKSLRNISLSIGHFFTDPAAGPGPTIVSCRAWPAVL